MDAWRSYVGGIMGSVEAAARICLRAGGNYGKCL